MPSPRVIFLTIFLAALFWRESLARFRLHTHLIILAIRLPERLIWNSQILTLLLNSYFYLASVNLFIYVIYLSHFVERTKQIFFFKVNNWAKMFDDENTNDSNFFNYLAVLESAMGLKHYLYCNMVRIAHIWNRMDRGWHIYYN